MPEHPSSQPPTFPSMNVQITPQGMVLSVMLAPGLSLTQSIGEDAMNEIMSKWVETRRQIRDHLKLIETVNASRTDHPQQDELARRRGK